MKRKVVWLMVSCMMALSLIMTSCGEAEEEEAGEVGGMEAGGGTVTVTTEEEEEGGTTVVEEEEEEEVVTAEAPIYGGKMATVLQREYTAWDPYYMRDIGVGHMMFTCNEYMQGDWTKGPSGTGETDFEIGFLGRVDLLTGEAADSYEMPDDTTIILNLHHGVYFQDKPPANGREMTADDAAWSIMMRFNNPGCWHNMAYPPGCGLEPSSAVATDRYTVDITVPAVSQEIMVLEITENGYVDCPEVWEGTGPGEGQEMGDWTKVVGTGPFIIKDYVSGSHIDYMRSDNYWEEDPLHPGNKLPYLDEFRHLFIADVSTIMAALRTAAIDFATPYAAITYDSAITLINNYPDLQWTRAMAPFARVLGMRMDRPEDPWYDLRVRQAVNLAVNQQEMLDDYYEGQGVLLGYPFGPTPTYEPYYVPLEEMPEEVSMLWDYDPERAMELLDEAGLGTGFQATVTCQAADVDELSLIAGYLADVNITLDLEVVESGAYSGRRNAREYDLVFDTAGIWAPFEMLETKYVQSGCVRHTIDPYYDEVQNVIGSNIISNPQVYIDKMKEACVYELSSAWGLWTPRYYQYIMWWPWVKDYNGAYWTGWAGSWDWVKYLWVDQDLKKQMGY
ncbi:ABC transporter substrate-binding protein [Chloroflexota bacterium]